MRAGAALGGAAFFAFFGCAMPNLSGLGQQGPSCGFMPKAQQAASQSGTGGLNGATSPSMGQTNAGGGSSGAQAPLKSSTVNGYTFAGLGPNDAGASAAKKAAYNYLAKNKVDPNDPKWATAAAKALNQTSPGAYTAPDGQTLNFGSDSIKTAANGYGLKPGTYDKNAKGEFYSPPSSPKSTKLGAPDQIDPSQIVMEDNPPDFPSWKRTATITSVRFGKGAFAVDFDKRDGTGRWPDETLTFGPSGPLQYTLGLCFYKGQWHCSGAIQYWYGRDLSITSDMKNWYYDGRWGVMAHHQPAYGEKVGFFVGAGNLRNMRDATQTLVKERSNFVVMSWPYQGGGTSSPASSAQSVTTSGGAQSTARNGVCGTPLTRAPKASGPDAIDLHQVVYDEGVDISDWKITSTLGSPSVGGGQICVPHSMSGKWPQLDFFGDPSTKVEGNMWLFANIGGVWHGGAADWLRPGQTCKGEDLNAVGANAFYNGKEPLKSWSPCPGELVGFAVSMPARAGQWGGAERSNVVLMPWPGGSTAQK